MKKEQRVAPGAAECPFLPPTHPDGCCHFPLSPPSPLPQPSPVSCFLNLLAPDLRLQFSSCPKNPAREGESQDEGEKQEAENRGEAGPRPQPLRCPPDFPKKRLRAATLPSWGTPSLGSPCRRPHSITRWAQAARKMLRKETEALSPGNFHVPCCNPKFPANKATPITGHKQTPPAALHLTLQSVFRGDGERAVSRVDVPHPKPKLCHLTGSGHQFGSGHKPSIPEQRGAPTAPHQTAPGAARGQRQRPTPKRAPAV